MALLALKNLLENAETAEEVVEAGTLEAVEALEYEKWRDPEVLLGRRGSRQELSQSASKYLKTQPLKVP